ncbi:MAG: hypothetical protein ACK6DZ_06760, partial [Acidobacteriota bacterium]
MPRIQEGAVGLLIAGTFLLVLVTDGLGWPTLLFCVALPAKRLPWEVLTTTQAHTMVHGSSTHQTL